MKLQFLQDAALQDTNLETAYHQLTYTTSVSVPDAPPPTPPTYDTFYEFCAEIIDASNTRKLVNHFEAHQNNTYGPNHYNFHHSDPSSDAVQEHFSAYFFRLGCPKHTIDDLLHVYCSSICLNPPPNHNIISPNVFRPLPRSFKDEWSLLPPNTKLSIETALPCKPHPVKNNKLSNYVSCQDALSMVESLSVDSSDCNNASFRSYYTNESEFELSSFDHGEHGNNSSIDSINTDPSGSVIANKAKQIRKPNGIHPHKSNRSTPRDNKQQDRQQRQNS